DKIVVLQGGVVEQVGSPMELYHHPRNRFVAGFIGSPKMNFLKVEARSSDAQGVTVTVPGGESVKVPVEGDAITAGQALELGIRPEHLMLDDQGPLAARVSVIERLGGQTSLYVEMDGELLTLMVDGDVGHRVGDRIRFGFAPSRAHLFDEQGLALAGLERHPLASLTRQDNRAASTADA
ncbi:MAG: TOBE domain-containing protein, partial [Pseudomonadota bacterium]|nr:TOBE domain-containing protein [Pseudomonadota bacterium]